MVLSPDIEGSNMPPQTSDVFESDTLAPRPKLCGLISGVATFVLSVFSAYAYLFYSNFVRRQQMLDEGLPPDFVADMGTGYGSGDIPAFAFWSIGVSLLVFVYVAWTTRRTFHRPIPIKFAYFLGIPCLTVAWTLFVASMLGPWMRAFSFPVFFCWLSGACAGTLLSSIVRPRRVQSAISK